MHQTMKGNEWRFGMKCHIGVDAGSGLVHTITVTAANVHDVTQAANLLREDDEVMYGDSGYLGIQKRPEITENENFAKIDYRINRRPGKLPRVSDNAIDWERYIENRKSSVRCKVEHAFRIIKCQFGYRKTAYRGLKKNENRLYAMFACANLYSLAIAGRKLSTTWYRGSLPFGVERSEKPEEYWLFLPWISLTKPKIGHFYHLEQNGVIYSETP